MSTRQLARLQRQKARDLQPAPEASEESDEAEEVPVRAKPRVSLFAALGDEDDADEDEQDEDDAEQEPTGTRQEVEETQAATSAKKSKKKKKKKKAKVSQQENAEAVEDEDEIDKALKELKLATRKGVDDSPSASDTQASARRSETLKINTYHLKAVNEMRNLFGREVIESANTEEEQDQRRQRRQGQQEVDLETYLREPPWAKKLPEVSLRRNVFIQGREHWPRQSAGGLTMREVEKAVDGSWTEYAYSYDKEYDRIQTLFFACVQIGDPMRMVHLLKQFPYHVSTLLQVSSVAKQDQNMALAAELCERALFSFGRVATSAFRHNIEAGRARLDFRRPENRQFWLGGYHYLKSLIRKGTYRTALEWAKLLYGLDPKDPYAMRHFIHFLAIRAYESGWLLEFLGDLDADGKDDTVYLRQSAVLAKLQLGDTEGARKDLVSGMQQVPWLYCALFQELGLDAPPSIWGINIDSNARSFWVKLYIYQAKDLWNNSQATGLLQDVAKTIERPDLSKLPSDDASPGQDTTRLAYLEGQTSLLAVAPRQLLDSQPNYEFDPLPPAEEENIFSSDGVRLPWENSRTSENQAQTDQLLARLQQLMPQRGGAEGAPAAGLGVPGGFGDDDEEGGADWDDDEELRRDLEAHASGANGPGLLATLMQMFGGRAGPAEEGSGEQGQDGEAEGLPGSWPEDDDGDDDRRRDEAHGS